MKEVSLEELEKVLKVRGCRLLLEGGPVKQLEAEDTNLECLGWNFLVLQ